jgi:hypothetical protein
MDLRRHLRVVWRFRTLVLSGVLLGVFLGCLAVVKVSTDGVQWRAKETWSSDSTVLVTQTGFPWGRVLLPGPGPAAAATPEPGATETPRRDELFADPSRFTNLAVVYSYFAESDRVRALMRPLPDRDQLEVVPAPAGMHTAETLPLLTVTTLADTPGGAERLNRSAIDALQRFLRDQQDAAKIETDNRVRIQVLNPSSKAKLMIGRSKTPAFVAFILCLVAALAVAYILDNLYPRRPTGPEAVADRPHAIEGVTALTAEAQVAEPARRAS